jgi:hypothetical protein
MPRSWTTEKLSRSGVKNSNGVDEAASVSDLNAFRAIQNTGKKKRRTRIQVMTVIRVPRVREFVAFIAALRR